MSTLCQIYELVGCFIFSLLGQRDLSLAHKGIPKDRPGMGVDH